MCDVYKSYDSRRSFFLGYIIHMPKLLCLFFLCSLFLVIHETNFILHIKILDGSLFMRSGPYSSWTGFCEPKHNQKCLDIWSQCACTCARLNTNTNTNTCVDVYVYMYALRFPLISGFVKWAFTRLRMDILVLSSKISFYLTTFFLLLFFSLCWTGSIYSSDLAGFCVPGTFLSTPWWLQFKWIPPNSSPKRNENHWMVEWYVAPLVSPHYLLGLFMSVFLFLHFANGTKTFIPFHSFIISADVLPLTPLRFDLRRRRRHCYRSMHCIRRIRCSLFICRVCFCLLFLLSYSQNPQIIYLW